MTKDITTSSSIDQKDVALSKLKLKIDRLFEKISKLQKYSDSCYEYIYNRNTTPWIKKLKKKKASQDIIMMCDKIDTYLSESIEKKKQIIKKLNELERQRNKESKKTKKQTKIKFDPNVKETVLEPNSFYYRAKRRTVN